MTRSASHPTEPKTTTPTTTLAEELRALACATRRTRFSQETLRRAAAALEEKDKALESVLFAVANPEPGEFLDLTSNRATGTLQPLGVAIRAALLAGGA